jgi:hypothetical protein
MTEYGRALGYVGPDGHIPFKHIRRMLFEVDETIQAYDLPYRVFNDAVMIVTTATGPSGLRHYGWYLEVKDE